MTRPFRASVDVGELPWDAVVAEWNDGREHIVQIGRSVTVCGRRVPAGIDYRLKLTRPTEACVWCARRLKRNGEEEK